MTRREKCSLTPAFFERLLSFADEAGKGRRDDGNGRLFEGSSAAFKICQVMEGKLSEMLFPKENREDREEMEYSAYDEFDWEEDGFLPWIGFLHPGHVLGIPGEKWYVVGPGDGQDYDLYVVFRYSLGLDESPGPFLGSFDLAAGVMSRMSAVRMDEEFLYPDFDRDADHFDAFVRSGLQCCITADDLFEEDGDLTPAEVCAGAIYLSHLINRNVSPQLLEKIRGRFDLRYHNKAAFGIAERVNLETRVTGLQDLREMRDTEPFESILMGIALESVLGVGAPWVGTWASSCGYDYLSHWRDRVSDDWRRFLDEAFRLFYKVGVADGLKALRGENLITECGCLGALDGELCLCQMAYEETEVMDFTQKMAGTLFHAAYRLATREAGRRKKAKRRLRGAEGRERLGRGRCGKNHAGTCRNRVGKRAGKARGGALPEAV